MELHSIGLLLLSGCAAALAAGGLRTSILRRRFEREHNLSDLRSLSRQQLDSIIAEAFRRRGYSIEVGDDDADLILRKDGEKLYVRSRQWRKFKIGIGPIREFFGTITSGDAAGGFFLSSGMYTQEACAFARDSAIELIDGIALGKMVREAQMPEPFLDPTIRKRRANTVFKTR